MAAARRVETILARHRAVMDSYDPDKIVGLVLDEWGTWWDVEPGTHPGFLYQQNTLRDALVAAVHFDVFHPVGLVLAADRVAACNDAEHPDTVAPRSVDVRVDGDLVRVEIPPHAFVTVRGTLALSRRSS